MKNNVFIAKGASVVGEVYLEDDVNIWYHATVRGDREAIEIGYGTNIQDNVVIHMDKGFPVKIGKYVSIGHGAILHGCTVDDGSLIGMGAILLDGAHIGKNCIIGAGLLCRNLNYTKCTNTRWFFSNRKSWKMEKKCYRRRDSIEYGKCKKIYR